MKKDIENIEDIKRMVDTFYDKVNQNEKLSAVFNDHAGVNWSTHLDKMYNFWNTVLFSKGTYKGSPFQKHEALPIDQSHFNEWLTLFAENIDEHFEGLVAEDAKQTAKNIGLTFQAKLNLL